MAVGSGWRLSVGRRWQLAVGGWRRLAVGGGWRLAVDGPLGRSLRAVLNQKKKISVPKDRPGCYSQQGNRRYRLIHQNISQFHMASGEILQCLAFTAVLCR